MSSPRTTTRRYWVAFRAMLVFTAVLGLAYPLTITLIGQLVLPAQANGSLVTIETDTAGTETVGSALIGQSFTDAKGTPLPEWFQPRPSAAGDGYDAATSSGSNWGPENPDLIQAVIERTQAIEESDGVRAEQIPADALTASASGLDPHISPAYARLQVSRVAQERGIPEASVGALIESNMQRRVLGYLGDPTVNVLELNIALAGLKG
ncbi:potassium-transporting ATPase subunit KdpC [Cryobacterium sp. TMT3-29-2]|uniref:potassium-transporting ATPase subunit KdpC n=1 Tax=Cryobacterium sp. TMT3-29-2 TaxID=2555867 RepID=UPI001073A3EB|nr:potassium-transporting ATPase subunit KdpC [Cryobacterium sp. TMT3-29-2]TFC82424.1 potassium-transporting ATPase subunit KdpC [Cryobacterium sp. TMT3-29-2]